MKKNIFLLTAGLLLGAVIGQFLPNVQISIVAKATDEIVLIGEPMGTITREEYEEHEAEEAEKAEKARKADEAAEDKVASETMHYEGVSEAMDPSLFVDRVELNLHEELVVREYNAYRVHNGRVAVLPRENLTERARAHNARIISGEESPYSGNLSRNQYVYSGIVSGEDSELPASTIINFWAHMEIGSFYILKEDITQVGVSVEKVDGKMYYTLILDWSEGVR